MTFDETYRARKDRSIEHEAVELSVFPTRINCRRKILEELMIKTPAREGGSEHRCVDAGDYGLKSLVNERTGQLDGVLVPDWEDCLHA